MSETINCGNCGMLLYFGEEIKRRLYMRAIPDESAVLAGYGNKCPRCGAQLSTDSVKVEIKRRAVHES
jgi:transcription elongation factor Elf1